MVRELVLKNRSYRRFYEDRQVSLETLKELVEICHNAPSGGNNQPLRYRLVCTPQENEAVFRTLAWAGYLKDWDGPVEGERPAAYVVMLAKEGVNCSWDEGIAGQTLLLAAAERGLGGCFIANVDRTALKEALSLPKELAVKLVIALGVPKEEVVLEPAHVGENLQYYRDEAQVHHVPKLVLEEVLVQ